MRFRIGSAAAFFKNSRASVQREHDEALERRLAKLVAGRLPEAAQSPVDRLSTCRPDVRAAPLYEQSVYGSLRLGDIADERLDGA